ncbi:MAG: hypothetical protein ABH830_02345 [Patescibacteria group bacterium]
MNKSIISVKKNIFSEFNNIKNSLWVSVSEAAKFGGVTTKTIRRALKMNLILFKIIKNRYLIDFTSLIIFLHSNKKLKNKFYQFGLGQFIDLWPPKK